MSAARNRPQADSTAAFTPVLTAVTAVPGPPPQAWAC